jgi:hypothetical protein
MSKPAKANKAKPAEEPAIKPEWPRYLTESTSRQVLTFMRTIDWTLAWDEFCNRRKANGALHYSSIALFCKDKAKDKWEERIFWRAMGPEPIVPKELKEHMEEYGSRAQSKSSKVKLHKMLIVPWLGDWEKKRANGFFSNEGVTQQALEKVLTEREGAVEAAKMIGRVTAGFMQKFQGLLEHLDNFFGGQVINPELSMATNERRMDFYYHNLKRIFNMTTEASELYLRCNGLHNDDLTQWANLAAMSATAGAMVGLQAGQAQPALGAGNGSQALLMMQAILKKNQRYRLPMPDDELQEIAKGSKDTPVNKTIEGKAKRPN